MFERLKQINRKELMQKIKGQRALKLLIIVGIIAIFGIVLSESFSTKSTQKKESADSTESLREYELSCEKRLEEILSHIEGIGKCRVMLTLDSSEQSVYSADTQSESQSAPESSSDAQKNTHVIVDDGGQKPVLEKQIEPKIRGVIVVCEGADDVKVCSAVIDSIRAGFGISSANISVVKGGKNG